MNETEKRFEKAIKHHLFATDSGMNGVNKALYDIHKEECVKFSEWIAAMRITVSTVIMEWKFDDEYYTTEELFDLFQQSKTEK